MQKKMYDRAILSIEIKNSALFFYSISLDFAFDFPSV